MSILDLQMVFSWSKTSCNLIVALVLCLEILSSSPNSVWARRYKQFLVLASGCLWNPRNSSQDELISSWVWISLVKKSNINFNFRFAYFFISDPVTICTPWRTTEARFGRQLLIIIFLVYIFWESCSVSVYVQDYVGFSLGFHWIYIGFGPEWGFRQT